MLSILNTRKKFHSEKNISNNNYSISFSCIEQTSQKDVNLACWKSCSKTRMKTWNKRNYSNSSIFLSSFSRKTFLLPSILEGIKNKIWYVAFIICTQISTSHPIKIESSIILYWKNIILKFRFETARIESFGTFSCRHSNNIILNGFSKLVLQIKKNTEFSESLEWLQIDTYFADTIDIS